MVFTWDYKELSFAADEMQLTGVFIAREYAFFELQHKHEAIYILNILNHCMVFFFTQRETIIVIIIYGVEVSSNMGI